ncbi:RNA polymerase beta subunit [Ureaplasma parvum serovar 3]|nr:RNA polymerase beta subunit [Ureaplasma parvum serovar 3]
MTSFGPTFLYLIFKISFSFKLFSLSLNFKLIKLLGWLSNFVSIKTLFISTGFGAVVKLSSLLVVILVCALVKFKSLWLPIINSLKRYLRFDIKPSKTKLLFLISAIFKVFDSFQELSLLL